MQGNPARIRWTLSRHCDFPAIISDLVNDVLDYNKMNREDSVRADAIQSERFPDEIMRSYSFRSKAKQLEFEIRKRVICR